MADMLTLEKFEEASEIVKEVTSETKLIYSEFFSNQTGNKVYLKPENMQYTGAYKLRGAYYKISTLTDEERSKGLIAASAGNHAQGVALAATRMGIKSVVCMPDGAPISKVEATKAFGAEVCLHGATYDDAFNIAEYAIPAMQYAAGSGIIVGKTSSTLNPEDNATRAEIAVILHRFIEKNKKI